jgi:predicted permease
MISTLWQDVRHAVRLLAARPGWTAVALVSLALGIGVSTTCFSVVDALLLRPLPVERPNELVELRVLSQGHREESFFYPDYREMVASTTAFSGLTAYSSRGSMLKQNGESVMLSVTVVDGTYFDVLGIRPLLGRLLNVQTDSSGDGSPTVVMSHSLWQRRFGGDPGVVGRSIALNGTFVTVVGVVPASFPGLQKGFVTDLWMSPAAWSVSSGARTDITARDSRQFEIVGRLKPGVSAEAARRQVAAVGARLRSTYPDKNRDMTFTAVMLAEEQARHARGPMIILLALVGLILWIACANVAGLELARGEARRRELGVRHALGASRTRLIRQLLTESALLSALGAAGGLLLASWLLSLLPLLLPPMPIEIDLALRLDLRVYLFTLALGMVSVLLVGLLPALRASRVDVMDSLKDSADGSRSSWSRAALVVGQVALAVVLINSAGLLLKSFARTRATSPGFDTARNIVALYMVAGRDADSAAWRSFYERLREQAAALPGVRRATYARRLPLFGSGGGASVQVEFPGLQLPDEQRRPRIHYNEVEPGYFATIGTRLLAGRGFTTADRTDGDRVAIVSAEFVRRYYPAAGGIGKNIVVSGHPTRIVGVAEDARINSIHEDAQPYVYFPFAQRPANEATFILETQSDPRVLAQTAKRLVAKLSAGSEVLETITMDDHMKAALFGDWLKAVVSAGLAALGAALAALGLFATVSHAVGRRMREFGVRLALGAQRRQLFRTVLGSALRMAGVGIVLGIAGTLAAGGVLRLMIYNMKPWDPPTLIAGALVSALIAVLATLQPARRATRVDVWQTLRWE